MPWYIAPTSLFTYPLGDIIPSIVGGKMQPSVRLYTTFRDLEDVMRSNWEAGDRPALTLIHVTIPPAKGPWTEIDRVPAHKQTLISTDFRLDDTETARFHTLDSS